MKHLRVLSVNNYNYVRGGAERVFIEQNAALRSIGFEVAEFCMQHPSNINSEWNSYFISNLEYQASDRPLDKLEKGARVIWNQESVRKLSKLIEDFSPTVAHLHNVYHHISWSILPVLKRHRIPVLMTLHDLKLLCPAHSMYRSGAVCSKCASGAFLNAVRHSCVKQSRAGSLIAAIDNILARTVGIVDRHVDVFIVPSRFYQKLFSDFGFPKDKLAYIPNFSQSVHHAIQEESGDRYLYFGRLSHEKGVQVLIRAASRLRAKVTIAGTGPAYADLRSLADKLMVDCAFVGHLNKESLALEIQRCRAVVLPSISYENAPLTILEAMRYGKVVVGTRSGGITELIVDGKTGFLFDPNDELALCLHLETLTKMSNLKLAAMGSACVEAASRYGVDTYIKSILDLYMATTKSDFR